MANLPGNRQDHPRVCGKDLIPCAKAHCCKGSSPRVREGPYISNFLSFHFRITPACAGRTIKASRCQLYHQDHPRVCGKDYRSTLYVYTPLGSPPRVRERLIVNINISFCNRITPACAGRTIMELNQFSLSRDHPRSRGKDIPKAL